MEKARPIHEKYIISVVYVLKRTLFLFKNLLQEKAPRESLRFLKDTVDKDIGRAKKEIGSGIDVLLSGTS
jgi:hypothetical protein